MSRNVRGCFSTREWRKLRVGELLRRSLSDLFLRDPLRDPGLAGVNIVITEVRLSRRMGQAAFFVRFHPQEADAEACIQALDRAAPYLRTCLASRLALRSMPQITFHLDRGTDYAMHVNKILSEVRPVKLS